MSYYYHITEAENLPGIMKYGLIPGKEAHVKGYSRVTDHCFCNVVFLAKSKEDCLQLAPCGGSYFALKKYGEHIKRIHDRFSQFNPFELEEKTMELYCLCVDMDGLENQLTERNNKQLEPLIYFNKVITAKEYLFDGSISKERIVAVESLSLPYITIKR